MKSSAIDGTRISLVTASRKVNPKEVFGANDEAKVAADACFLLRNGINRCSWRAKAVGNRLRTHEAHP